MGAVQSYRKLKTTVQSSYTIMPCFQRCCCCVNLRTGGLMMGVMTLALSVFSIVPMALSLNNRLYLSRVVVHMLNRYARPTEEVKIEEQQSPFEPMEFWGTVSEMFKKDGPDQLPAEDDTKVTRLAAAMLIFFIVCIILLMYGSVRGSRWLILPWLVATFLFILAYIAGMCLSTVLFGITLLSLAFLTIAIIESCIALYLWLCVISLFQLLADRHGNQAYELKPRLNTSYKGIPTDER